MILINKTIILLFVIFINHIIRAYYINKKIKNNYLYDNSSKISIVIPFYNEEKVLLKTLESIVKLNLQGELILIDDGSNDKSVSIVNNLIINHFNNDFIIKLYHTSHMGKGHALKIGFEKCKYDCIVMTDADGEFDINVIPTMIKLYNETGNSIIAKRNNISIDKKIYSFFYWVFFGIYLEEPTSGTRVFNKSILHNINNLTNDFTVELVLNQYMGELSTIQYIEVDYIRRTIEQGKKLFGKVKLKFFLESIILFLKQIFMISFIRNQIKKYILLKFTNDSIINKNDYKQPIKHISFILDGNRRYSNKHNMIKKYQHLIGFIKTTEIIEHLKNNVKKLSLYVFATNNWKRNKNEINNIMNLIDYLYQNYKKQINGNYLYNVKINFITTSYNFDENITNKINSIKDISDKIKNPILTIDIYFSYSGREEIINAFDKYNDNLSKDDLTFSQKINILDDILIRDNLPPDIMIRTGGDSRLSDFMLYQSAYTELFFIKKYLPEISTKDIDNIIKEFHERKRNFGK